MKHWKVIRVRGGLRMLLTPGKKWVKINKMKPTTVFHEAAEGEGSREHRGRQKEPVSPKCNTKVRGLRLICGGDAWEWRCFKPVILSVVPKSSAAAALWKMLQMHIPRLLPRPSGTVGWGQCLCFHKLSAWFRCRLKAENSCFKPKSFPP